MISKELARAVLDEHINCFDDTEVKWVNYPFTTTYEVGIGYGGQANFYNIFTLDSDVKLWVLSKGYIINTNNLSGYKFDDPDSYNDYSTIVRYSYKITSIDNSYTYTGPVFSEEDRLSDYEVEIATVMAAGEHILNIIKE